MRRHLGYTPEDVDRMPWWQLRMFIEGLNVEFAPPDEADTGDPDAETTDDLSSMGFNVQSIA